jgi:hypothetical protein
MRNSLAIWAMLLACAAPVKNKRVAGLSPPTNRVAGPIDPSFDEELQVLACQSREITP